MKNGPILCDVDLPSLEHGLYALTEVALIGKVYEELYRLIGDTVLRVVEVKAGAFNRQALAADAVSGE
jgi:hypothetical protein